MWLTDAQAQAIINHARADAPNEACGLIVGRRDHVTEIILIPNSAVNPQHAYRMDERALIAALSKLEARGLELIGIYHSHPASDSIPSQTDIRQATYPDTPYLIVGLKNSTTSLAAWKMRAGQVSEVPLQIGSTPPLARIIRPFPCSENGCSPQRLNRVCAAYRGIVIFVATCAPYSALTGDSSCSQP